MSSTITGLILAGAVVAATLRVGDQTAPGPRNIALSLDRLTVLGVTASIATHEGRRAVRLVESDAGRGGGIALIEGLTMEDGEIRLDVAGRRGSFAQPDDRGFIGVAFRVAAGAARYEYIYLRPDNGRADNQEQRNHATQYASHPDFPWQVLRKTFPGRYESYVDLVPGAWTQMRVVVRGATARLHVHGSAQPALIVNDLKLRPASGQLGLWIGAGTEAFFGTLSVSTIPAGAP